MLTEARFYLIEGLIELLEQEESNELIEKHILKDDLRFDGYTSSSCSQIYKENTRKRGGRMVFRLGSTIANSLFFSCLFLLSCRFYADTTHRIAIAFLQNGQIVSTVGVHNFLVFILIIYFVLEIHDCF